MLVVVDDLPWVDRASAAVFAFVARRLAGSRVRFLAAMRSGADGFFERGGLPTYELPPLDTESATRLVDDRFPNLARQVRQRLLGAARGNPLALLELLGARPWAERAAKELRAAGQAVPSDERSGAEELTPQEREIAELAASGLTNKQIAERLYISHHTVGAYLYRLCPKLGINSRSALRDALVAHDTEPGDPGP
ncbi:LuxR C-terminal-related transcriptional regulator [Streptomyces sp. BBFR51]|uniref:LuxR C-terminal-related transcriptional regulator n=1 Tax=Streptomyces sp. BBFR51 TaxID=3372856 RepID=UPI0037DC1078